MIKKSFLFYSMIRILPFIHLFSLSSILPFSHSIRLVRPFVCASVQLFSSFVHPFSPSIHLSIYFICPSICSFSPFIQFIQPCCLPVYLSVYLSISLSIRSVSIHLSVCPSGNITVCPICLLVPPSIHLSICPSVHPSILYINSVCLVIHLFSLSICPFRLCSSVHLSFQGTF